jgi:hypothetical protein
MTGAVGMIAGQHASKLLLEDADLDHPGALKPCWAGRHDDGRTVVTAPSLYGAAAGEVGRKRSTCAKILRSFTTRLEVLPI